MSKQNAVKQRKKLIKFMKKRKNTYKDFMNKNIDDYLSNYTYLDEIHLHALYDMHKTNILVFEYHISNDKLSRNYYYNAQYKSKRVLCLLYSRHSKHYDYIQMNNQCIFPSKEGYYFDNDGIKWNELHKLDQKIINEINHNVEAVESTSIRSDNSNEMKFDMEQLIEDGFEEIEVSVMSANSIIPGAVPTEDMIRKILNRVAQLKKHNKYKTMQQQNMTLTDSELIALIYYTESQNYCSKMKLTHRKLVNESKYKTLYFHATNAIAKMHKVFHYKNEEQSPCSMLYHGSTIQSLDPLSQEQLFLKTMFSFSTNMDVAAKFATGTVLIIDYAQSALYDGRLKGADVSWISAFKQEAEYIILPTTFYKWRKVHRQGIGPNINVYITADYISNFNSLCVHADTVIPKMKPNYNVLDDIISIINDSVQNHHLIQMLQKYVLFMQYPNSHCLNVEDIDSIDINQMNNEYLELLQNNDHGLTCCNVEQCNIYNLYNSTIINFQQFKHTHHFQHIKSDVSTTLTLSKESENRIFILFQLLDKAHVTFQHAQHSKHASTKKGKLTQHVSKMIHQRVRKKFVSNLSKHSSESTVIANYDFGTAFLYGYDNEYVPPNSVSVKPTFNSLKEELTSNDICTLSMRHFNQLVKKATILQQSQHAKRFYPNLPIDCIIALMVHCNFDTLNTKFCETFRNRDVEANTHIQYYYLGMHIKMAIHQHGYHIKDNNISVFYHGIDKEFLFPSYLENIHMNFPFSTSSNFTVATRFAGPNGLILKFGDQFGYNKRFSVEWLSDYPFENEYLFMQNKYSLKINSITTVKNAAVIEFKALQIIQNLITNQKIDAKDSMVMQRMYNILTHQRSALSKNNSVVVFNKYELNVIETYCNNQKKININHNWLKNECKPLFSWFFDDNSLINIETIFALFPKVEHLVINDITVVKPLIENIYVILRDTKIKSVQLHGIIGENDDSDMIGHSALLQYEKKFKEINIISTRNKGSWYFHQPNCNIPIPSPFSIDSDPIYAQLHKYFESNQLFHKLIAIIYKYNQNNKKQIKIKNLIEVFSENHINESYFVFDNTKKFNTLLQEKCNISCKVSTTIWNDLKPLAKRVVGNGVDFYEAKLFGKRVVGNGVDFYELKSFKKRIILSVSSMQQVHIPPDDTLQAQTGAKKIVLENDFISDEKYDDKNIGARCLEIVHEALQMRKNYESFDVEMISEMDDFAASGSAGMLCFNDNWTGSECSDSPQRAFNASKPHIPMSATINKQQTLSLDEHKFSNAIPVYANVSVSRNEYSGNTVTLETVDPDEHTNQDFGNASAAQCCMRSNAGGNSSKQPKQDNTKNNNSSDNHQNQDDNGSGSSGSGSSGSGGGGGRKNDPNKNNNNNNKNDNNEEEEENEDEDEKDEDEDEQSLCDQDNDSQHTLNVNAKPFTLSPSKYFQQLETINEKEQTMKTKAFTHEIHKHNTNQQFWTCYLCHYD
eukprot:177455_1